jgi:hypothetical protein
LFLNNPEIGEFVIVESKFHGTGGLAPANPIATSTSQLIPTDQ